MKYWRGASLILIFALVCGYAAAYVNMNQNYGNNPAAQQGSTGSEQQGTGPLTKPPDYTMPQQGGSAQGQGYGQQPAGAYGQQVGNGGQCAEPHPDCSPNGPPDCSNGKWICPAGQGQQSYNGNNFQFNSGVPDTSFASSEYMAQQKMIDGMTTAYNWISLNSAKFVEGCKGDRSALYSELSGIMAQAQDASTICARFGQEAKSCNPELLCEQMMSGKFLPPQMEAALKKAGYDPENLGAGGITQEMIVKACIVQGQPQIDARTQMIENAKQGVLQQIPGVRANCEAWKKNQQGQGPNITLPQINIQPQMVMQNMQQQRTMQQRADIGEKAYYKCTPETTPKCQPNEHPECRENAWNCVAPQQSTGEGNGGMMQCPPQGPDCGPNAPPYCENGTWRCPQAQQQEQATQQTETSTTTTATETTTSTTQEETGTTTTETGGGTDSGSAQTAAEGGITASTTGLMVAGSGTGVCGNGLCEPDLGESYENCGNDCMKGTQIAETQKDGTWSSVPSQAVAGIAQQGGGTMVATSSSGGGGGNIMPAGQQVQGGGQYGQPMGGGQYVRQSYVQGPSPEMLCGMTDDEIVSAYVTMPMNAGNDVKMLEYNCQQESWRILGEMNNYKLGKAKCSADAALDCEAKNQAVKNCNEFRSDPSALAKEIVDNGCRRFGVTATGADTEGKLYDVAKRWINSDPALGNQLMDTADKKLQEQKSLGIGDYLIGNGDYSNKLSETAKSLRAIREKMVSGGVTDTDTLTKLDEEAKALETEAGQFNNLAGIIGRLGLMFGR